MLEYRCDGLRCQVSGGAKAHVLRGITSFLDRLEDPSMTLQWW